MEPCLRADALRNRNAILEATARLYADRGSDIPMADIAAEAGVGRATLLRNFPTRSELAAALFDRSINRVRDLAASQQGRPGDLEELLALKLQLYVESGGLAEAIQQELGVNEGFAAERLEVAELLLAAAQPGIAAGLLRPDLSVEMFLILQQSLTGAMRSGGNRKAREARAAIVRSLLLDGIKHRE